MTPPRVPDVTDAELRRLACLEKHDGYCASVSIRADDGRTYSFASAHYLDAVHEANVLSDTDAPPERLALRFTTGEVVVLGTRLERIEDALAEGQIRRLQPISPRYTALLKSGPVIISIAVHRKSDV